MPSGCQVFFQISQPNDKKNPNEMPGESSTEKWRPEMQNSLYHFNFFCLQSLKKPGIIIPECFTEKQVLWTLAYNL